MPAYALKQPIIVDFYEGEYPVYYPPVYRTVFKASGKFYDGFKRQDKKVEEYVNIAKDKGQQYGLYHFLLPNDVTQQIDLFLNVVSKMGMGHMPVTLDVECNTISEFGVSRKEWGHQIKVFLDAIEKETKIVPTIYSNIYYWGFVDYTGWNPDYYPLWAAQYIEDKYINSVNAPYPFPSGWSKWAMWQYRDDGRTQRYFINDLNIPSAWFRKYLDETWGTMIPPVEELIFPYKIFMEGKTYAKQS